MSARGRGIADRAECIEHVGKNTRCGQIAGQLAATEANLRKLAKVAARSRESYDHVRGAIAQAKADREKWRQERLDHMAECPYAADRFGASL